jgi:hypothetical protein
VLCNLFRGLSIPIIFAFQSLRQVMSISEATALIGCCAYIIGFWTLRHMRETHGLDLDYVETLETRTPPAISR